MSYGINPFKDEVVCDVSPLEDFYFISVQTHMLKYHAIYVSLPYSVIVTLGGQLYRVPNIDPTTTNSLILAKQCCKVIFQTTKFLLFMIQSHGEQNIVVATIALAQDIFIQ
jgi:hypothetical protein